MRLRVRGPTGQSTISLNDTATVQDLRTQIVDKTGLASYDVKYGYPDIKPLALNSYQPEQKIADIGVNLNSEQLIITKKIDTTEELSRNIAQASPQPPSEKLSLSRNSRNIPDDPPEIPSPDHGGTFILRIMPDDNSCLFRAVGTALMGGMDAMNELRSIVAQAIQADTNLYSEAVLERKPDDYCRWIQNEDSWGGGIELSILSKHFDIEICSIDVQTLRVDRFNEGPPTRCVLVYSGIHYDTIGLSPSDPPYNRAHAPPDFDTKVFDVADQMVLEKSIALCQLLQAKHYYTDTAGFRIRCNACGGVFVGERGAAQHAAQTGHYDFGEAS